MKPNNDQPKTVKKTVQPQPSRPTTQPAVKWYLIVQGVFYVVVLSVMVIGLLWMVGGRGQMVGQTAEVSPTETPTIEAMITSTQEITGNSVTVGEYTFSFPQEVPDGRGSVEIMGWLPDSSDEIIDTRDNQIFAINTHTGKTREVSPEFGDDISVSSVKLLNDNQVGFTTYNYKTKDRFLWINDTLVLTDIDNFSIVISDYENLWVFDSELHEGRILQGGKEARQTPIDISSVLKPLSILDIYDPESDSMYTETVSLQSTSSPATSWTAIYNRGHFSLVDLQTGTSQAVALDDTGQWVDYAVWSPDGQKLALLVTEGDLPLPYEKLFVLDTANLELSEIETDFQYVTNVTWAPDSENLLIIAKTNDKTIDSQGDKYTISQLFLVNIFSESISHVPVLPNTTVTGFIWKLSWSPDGKKIAFGGTFKPVGNSHLYLIDVTSQ